MGSVRGRTAALSADPGDGIAADIEVRSIDYVPEDERHGRVRDQFTLWFSATLTILGILLGAIAVEIVGNFFWGVLAWAIGTVLGLLLVGFHAVQGPRLGVPQMIQSRAQFGFYGALFVLAASVVLDFGYLAAQLVVQAQSLNVMVSSVSIPVWIIIVAIPGAARAVRLRLDPPDPARPDRAVRRRAAGRRDPDRGQRQGLARGWAARTCPASRSS